MAERNERDKNLHTELSIHKAANQSLTLAKSEAEANLEGSLLANATLQDELMAAKVALDEARRAAKAEKILIRNELTKQYEGQVFEVQDKYFKDGWVAALKVAGIAEDSNLYSQIILPWEVPDESDSESSTSSEGEPEKRVEEELPVVSAACPSSSELREHVPSQGAPDLSQTSSPLDPEQIITPSLSASVLDHGTDQPVLSHADQEEQIPEQVIGEATTETDGTAEYAGEGAAGERVVRDEAAGKEAAEEETATAGKETVEIAPEEVIASEIALAGESFDLDLGDD